MIVFQYSPETIAKFPDVVGGIIVGRDLKSGDSPDELKASYIAEQERVKAKIGDTPLSEIESLSAWRRTFSAFGVNPTKYRSAAESLLRRLTKKGDIPSINLLVDIGNLVSIRYGLPVAVLDARQINGAVTVRPAKGNERFRELDNEEIIHPEVGEIVFTDATDMVIARRWCWRQSDESAARHDTTSVIITVEAQHSNSFEDVKHAVDDLLMLLKKYAGGHTEHAILDAKNPAIEVVKR